jgi:hypothetical protein
MGEKLDVEIIPEFWTLPLQSPFYAPMTTGLVTVLSPLEIAAAAAAATERDRRHGRKTIWFPTVSVCLSVAVQGQLE